MRLLALIMYMHQMVLVAISLPFVLAVPLGMLYLLSLRIILERIFTIQIVVVGLLQIVLIRLTIKNYYAGSLLGRKCMNTDDQKIYSVKEASGNFYLHGPVNVYDCGNRKDVNFFDKIIFLILLDFFNESIAEEYCFQFGLSVLKYYHYKPLPIFYNGFNLCGIIIKNIMKEVTYES